MHFHVLLFAKMEQQQVESWYLNYLPCKLNLWAWNYWDVYSCKNQSPWRITNCRPTRSWRTLAITKVCGENVICGSENENEINLFNRTPHYVLELKCTEYKLQNVKLYVICIQEIWLDDAADSISYIYGFNCFVQGKHCRSHGGLITHVDSRLNAAEICSMNNSSMYEDLLVSIYATPHKTKVVLGYTYRPPFDNTNEEKMNAFISELNPIIGQKTTTIIATC